MRRGYHQVRPQGLIWRLEALSSVPRLRRFSAPVAPVGRNTPRVATLVGGFMDTLAIHPEAAGSPTSNRDERRSGPGTTGPSGLGRPTRTFPGISPTQRSLSAATKGRTPIAVPASPPLRRTKPAPHSPRSSAGSERHVIQRGLRGFEGFDPLRLTGSALRSMTSRSSIESRRRRTALARLSPRRVQTCGSGWWVCRGKRDERKRFSLPRSGPVNERGC